MKTSPFIFFALVTVPASASAAILALGGGLAKSCYEAAEARNATIGAMDTCTRALNEEALSPHDRVATHVNRGILHLNRANLRAANADFNAALAMDPNEPEAWLNKAIGHAKFGRTIDALPLAEKALALNTRRPALAYFVRAMALEDSGNIVGAYRDLRRARSLEPKWKEPEIELRRFRVRQEG